MDWVTGESGRELNARVLILAELKNLFSFHVDASYYILVIATRIMCRHGKIFFGQGAPITMER